MIQKTYRRLKNIPIVRVSSLTAIATLVRIATNFILSKILAVTVGPAGIALVGQMINGSNIFMNIATGGLSQGVTKYIAESENENDRKRVINTAYTFVLILSTSVALVLLLFSKKWSQILFHTTEYWDAIVYLGVFVFFFAYNNIILAVINGLKQFKIFVVVNIANNIVGLILTLVLLYFWGLHGALIATVLYQSVVFFVTIFFIAKQKEVFKFTAIVLPKDLTQKLVGFSLMTFVSVICVAYSQIFIRGYIAKNLSLSDAGIWEGLNRLSAGYLLFASASLATYYLPRLSEIKEPVEVWKEIVNSSKAILPFVACASLLVFLFRKLIIIVLFDQAFFDMQQLFCWQIIGDFFKIAAWMLAYVMWAKRWVLEFIISEILLAIGYAAITTFLIGKASLGMQGSSLGYCITYVFYFVFMLILVRKKLGISYRAAR